MQLQTRISLDEYDRATLQRLPDLTNTSLDVVTNAMLKAHDGTPSWQLYNWYYNEHNRDRLSANIQPIMDAWLDRTMLRRQGEEGEELLRRSVNTTRTLLIGVPVAIGVVALGWWLAK